MTEKKKLRPETMGVHAGQEIDPTTMARAVPIYQTTSYGFQDTDHAANLFGLQEFGNIYSRIMNPTTDVLEKRLTEMEGGAAAVGTASGQAAVTYSILNIAGAGDEIVSAGSLYGGTYNLFSTTLPKLGITVRFVDASDPENFREAINEKTKLVFAESIGNPQGHVLDMQAVADIAHEHGVPLIVDNTVPSPYLFRPFEHGADIVVHSATKFIGGHGTTIGGMLIDGGTFDWAANDKFPGLTTPDPSYNGIVYTDAVGPIAYAIKARVQLLRDLGSALSPFNSFLLLQGLETLHLRMERHSENARKVAAFLEAHEDVDWVSYAGLPSHPTYERAQQLMPKGQGAILTFGIKGGIEAGKKVIHSVNLFSHVANIGDAKSLIIHPASTTHQQLNEEDQKKAGVSPGMIRLSIGIEAIEDIIEDLDQAIRKAVEAKV